MDRIFIRELPVVCVVGVHAFERSSRQQLLISVELELSFESAARNDELAGTVDYTAVARQIERIAVQGRFQLIETLAVRLAEALLITPVTAVHVEIQKPAALSAARGIGVRVSRPSGTEHS